MKHVYTLLIATVLGLGANAQSVFYEDFENGITAQFTQEYLVGNIDWQSDPANVNLGPGPGVFDGDSSAFFYEGAYSGNITTLTSPSLDLSSGGYRLSFAHIQPNWIGDQNTLSVYASEDDGVTWVLIDSLTGDVQDYVELEYLLGDFISESATVKVRFSGWIDYGYSIGLDNVNIFTPESDDAELVEAVSPVGNCGLGSEIVAVAVYNNGLDDILTINASYELDGQVETETFTVEIASGQTDTLFFSVPADLSIPGTYDFTAWVSMDQDNNAVNDTITFSVVSIPEISTLPYSEGFETGAGGWATGGTASTWELGTPAGALISEANNGSNAWVTNLDGDYATSEMSYVESPCFNFSSLTVDPVFRFAHIFDTENCCDEGYVDISLDGGLTWSRLGAAGEGINWYDDATNNEWDGTGVTSGGTQWRTAEHRLDNTAGEAQVRIRIAFSSDGSIENEGFGFDDIQIFEFPTINATATEITSPTNACGLGLEDITVVIENTGLEDLVDFEIGYDVGAGAVTQIVGDTLFVGEIDTITFSVQADLSAVGEYSITSWTAVVGDGDLGNDSTTTIVSNIPVISTLPYAEGFETGANGWVAGGTNSTWELGVPSGTLISEANNGSNAWVTNLAGDYVPNELSYVESPCLDFSSYAADPVFRFAHIFDTENCCDEGYIDISIDGGLTWSRLGAAGEGINWYDDATNNEWDGTGVTSGGTQWRTAEHLLDNTSGESQVKIRITFSSDGSIQNEGFGFDDIQIFEQPAINASVTEILSPVSGCGLGTELVTIVIENTGDDYLVDFNIEYDAGAGVVTQLVTDTLFASTIDTITFTVPADLSTLGTYGFGAWTAVVGDGDTGNDSLFTVVNNIPVLSGLPYVEGFESGPNGWITGGVASTWELGDPQGTFIDTANSGINAWVTNLDGAYAVSELSYIESPCFDFSALVIDPILEFAQIYQTESCCDEGFVDISLDGGNTWSRLGVSGEGQNWYNDAGNNWWDGTSGNPTEWRTVIHLLDGAAGESSVKIRFVFSSDGSIQNEGFGIDDISITEQPPINGELTAIVAPATSCGLTASESVSVTVTNLGSVDMDSVMIAFSLDNGVIVSEVFNDTLSPNESGTYTFSQTVDLSALADYDLTAWVTTIGDGDNDNDTLSTQFTNVPIIASFPYLIDFESGANGWVTTGVEGVWELGDPETAFIDTANSGVNAWVTVLNGNYPNLDNDTTYVESPCLDFSSLSADPILSFAGIFRTESCCDEGWVEVSLDGGATYTKLGVAGEGVNWYNDAFDNFWNGTSGGANEWLNAEHLIDGAAGQSEVKIRFAFSADGSITDVGFGLDDINIFAQPELDLVAISMDTPSSGCSLGEETVTMTFWNKGLQTVSGFELGFIVDAGTAQYETYTGSVANGDTVTYTFTTELADLSAPGTHVIDVFTALVGDERLSSDTVSGSTILNNGTITPLSQTAEPTGAIISSTITQGTTSEIFFCGLPDALDGCFEIVSLSINSIQHTWLSDLAIYLISPNGDSLEVSTNNGGSGDDMVNVVFTDTASTSITSQTAGILSGYYTVEDSAGFSTLYNGEDPNGPWTLWISDQVGGDDGQLISWTLTFQDNNPQPELAYSDTTICLTHVLTVGTGQFDSYLWSTGNNSQEIDLFGNILGIGTHEIFVTVDQDGCTGTSSSFILTVDACTGISELEGLTIDVYPNPTTGNIVLDIVGESDGFAVSVVDMNGKLVYTETIGSITIGSRSTIDLTDVANGIYFLRLEDGNSFTTRKLVKQ